MAVQKKNAIAPNLQKCVADRDVFVQFTRHSVGGKHKPIFCYPVFVRKRREKDSCIQRYTDLCTCALFFALARGLLSCQKRVSKLQITHSKPAMSMHIHLPSPANARPTWPRQSSWPHGNAECCIHNHLMYHPSTEHYLMPYFSILMQRRRGGG